LVYLSRRLFGSPERWCSLDDPLPALSSVCKADLPSIVAHATSFLKVLRSSPDPKPTITFPHPSKMKGQGCRRLQDLPLLRRVATRRLTVLLAGGGGAVFMLSRSGDVLRSRITSVLSHLLLLSCFEESLPLSPTASEDYLGQLPSLLLLIIIRLSKAKKLSTPYVAKEKWLERVKLSSSHRYYFRRTQNPYGSHPR